MNKDIREQLTAYKATLDELLESASKHDAAFDAMIGRRGRKSWRVTNSRFWQNVAMN